MNGKEFVCQQCGKKFFVPQYEVNYRPNIKYCSTECYHASTRKPPLVRNCLHCGKEFIVDRKHKEKKFCNIECACSYKRHSNRTATFGADGYKYVWFSDGSGQKEHRYIIEQHLGRKLSTDEVVHHIDGNRANNTISNLVVMSRGEHSALHRKKELDSGKILFRSDTSANQQSCERCKV